MATTPARMPRSQAIEDVQEQLRALHAAVNSVNHQVAELLKINRTDLQCLDLLSQHGPLPAGRITALMRLSASATTTVLDRLEDNGFVVRDRGSSDRRKVVVSMSDTARTRIGALYGSLQRSSAANLRRYTADQLELIRDFLASSVELTAGYTPSDSHGEGTEHS